MPLAAKNHLSEPVGLKNDIVSKVFTCPECKTDVTVSKWQVAGELHIVCARCNTKWQVKGEELLDLNPASLSYFPEKILDGKITKQSIGYKVFIHTDATQKVTPVPKDSFINVMKPPAAVPKPPVAAPGAPKPAGAPVAGAPVVAKPPVAAPAPAQKPAEGAS